MKIAYNLLMALLVILSGNILCNAQIITSIAGNGAESYMGDGGLADTSALSRPIGVVVDKKGNVYIADIYNQRIRKIDTAGIITTIAGNTSYGFSGDGGPAVDALLAFPSAIAIDGIGNLYIADEVNERIRKIDTAGIINTIAGNGNIGSSGDGGPALSAEFDSPTGVAVDRLGNVYVADASNNRIRKISASGIITTIAGNGTAGYSGNGGLGTIAEINDPLGIAVDDTGNVYFDDWSNECVRKIDPSGIISAFAGNTIGGYSGDGGPATGAEFFGPSGVSIDTSGNVYITDGGNQVVRVVKTNGYIYPFAGSGTQGFSGDGGLALDADLNDPYGTVVDQFGDLIIADYENNRIRKVYPVPDTVSICTGNAIQLNNTLVGGVYASSAGSIVSVNPVSGIATGITPGSATIYYTVGIDSAFTQIIVTTCTGAGISNIANNDIIQIYPTPSSSVVTITATSMINSITIKNLVGETVYSRNEHSNHVEVNVVSYPAGIYLISINGSEVRKFVKE